MIKQILIGSLIMFGCFSSGCTTERASDIDEDIARLQQEVKRLEQYKQELAVLPEEIEKLKAAVVTAEEKKEKFFAENPGLKEFYRKEMTPLH